MDRKDHETPAAEELFSPPEEYPQPTEEAEFRPPDREAEHSPPMGTDYPQPEERQEFTPPGRSAESVPDRSRHSRRLRRLLYAATALVMTGLLFTESKSAPLSPVVRPQSTPVVTEASASPEPTPAPPPPRRPRPRRPPRRSPSSR